MDIIFLLRTPFGYQSSFYHPRTPTESPRGSLDSVLFDASTQKFNSEILLLLLTIVYFRFQKMLFPTFAFAI
jgi:hypothetical protein